MDSSLDRAFRTYMGMRDEPSEHDLALLTRARHYLRYARLIPGIRAVLVCNSVAMYASHAESDIDLFVVTAPGRIWLVRMLLTVILQLLGMRVRAGQTAGQMCLGFFVTTDALDLAPVRIEDDIYMEYWYRTLHPILDLDHTYDTLLRTNTWYPLDDTTHSQNTRFVLTDTKRVWYDGWRLWDSLNTLCRRILLPRTLRIVQSHPDPWGVVVSDSMLKLHYEDRRREVRDNVIGQREE